MGLKLQFKFKFLLATKSGSVRVSGLYFDCEDDMLDAARGEA